ncbi:hypothetical protein L6R53_22390 [Myxococcota bacterium]|nr:hypothetical protein [Myxococcota bacterium]
MVPYATLGLPPAITATIERHIGALGHLELSPAELEPQGQRAVDQSAARLVFVGLPADPAAVEDALAAAHALVARDRIVALVGGDPTPALLLQAMRLGCRDVVSADDGEALARLAEAAAGDGAALVGGAGGLVAVLGSHGGVGTTTVALALAELLARDPTRGVVVVDLDQADRTLRAVLDLPAGLTARGLLRVAATMDPVKVRGALTRRAEGFWVLGQDEDVLTVPPVEAEELPAMVSLLRRAFTTVVVDLGSTFGELAWQLVDDAHLGVLVTTQDLMALRTARTRLDQLERLGLQGDQVALVVNRYAHGAGPSEVEIEERLGAPVAALLPDAPRLAQRALDEGLPLSEVAERGRVADGLDHLVERLTGSPPRRRRRWWSPGR